MTGPFALRSVPVWLGALVLSGLGAGASAQSVERGKALYSSRCGACHSVDSHRVGPLHAGVLGRKAGSEPGYDYSPALRQSRVVWTRDRLKAWLADPEALIPGQRMGYSMGEAQDREDVVAYLATLRR